ncbi:TPA: hypothetical protein DCX16_03855 [bacterium]|nr:hypothetical protein [bacterium]
MKKTLLGIVVAMIIALPVLAKMPKINVGGEVKVSAEEINNIDFKNTDPVGLNDDKDSHVKHRVRINLDAELSDGIGAHFCIQKNDDASTYWARGERTLQELQDKLTLRHAYLTVKDVGGLVDLTLGRQGIGVEDRELVMRRDVDAVKVETKLANLSLTGICGKIGESGVSKDTDTDLQGITGTVKLPIIKGVDLTAYGYRKIERASNKDASKKTNVYGAKVSGKLDVGSALKYSAEYCLESGTPSDTGKERDAKALRVCFGYETDVEGLGALAIEGSYLKMSGKKEDKTAYEGIAQDLDYYAALLDENEGVLAGKNGRKDININAEITPEAIENITLGISYTKFTSAEKADGKTDLGSELDLSVTYEYSKKTSFGLTYARFTPGEVQKAPSPGPGKGNDAATMIKCELLTKF